jgi:hypothetical protein
MHFAMLARRVVWRHAKRNARHATLPCLLVAPLRHAIGQAPRDVPVARRRQGGWRVIAIRISLMVKRKILFLKEN